MAGVKTVSSHLCNLEDVEQHLILLAIFYEVYSDRHICPVIG